MFACGKYANYKVVTTRDCLATEVQCEYTVLQVL